MGEIIRWNQVDKSSLDPEEALIRLLGVVDAAVLIPEREDIRALNLDVAEGNP